MALSYEQAYNLARSDSSITKPMVNAQGLNNLANILQESIENKRKQKGDYGKEMQKILDNDGALSSVDKENARELISGSNYDQFVNGNSDEQKKALDKLKNWEKQHYDFTGIMHDFASAERYGGLSNHFLDSERGRELMSLADDSERSLELMENGEDLGVRLTDWDLISETESNIVNIESKIGEFETLISEGLDPDDNRFQSELDSLYAQRDELQDLLNAGPTRLHSLQEFESMIMKKDTNSRDVLIQAAKMQRQDGFNASPEDDVIFNYNKNYNFVNNTLIQNGNFNSLVTDEIMPGRIFKNDFIKMIQGATDGTGTMVQGTTYADLGITPEMLEGADTNIDDEIDEDEATAIYNAVMENKETSRQYLSEYFVTFLENNFNQGKHDRGGSSIKENNDEPITAEQI